MTVSLRKKLILLFVAIVGIAVLVLAVAPANRTARRWRKP
jgi:hypothetical protein